MFFKISIFVGAFLALIALTFLWAFIIEKIKDGQEVRDVPGFRAFIVDEAIGLIIFFPFVLIAILTLRSFAPIAALLWFGSRIGVWGVTICKKFTIERPLRHLDSDARISLEPALSPKVEIATGLVLFVILAMSVYAGYVYFSEPLFSDAAAQSLLRVVLYAMPIVPILEGGIKPLLVLVSADIDEETRTDVFWDALGGIFSFVFFSGVALSNLHGVGFDTQVLVPEVWIERVPVLALVGSGSLLLFIVLAILPYWIGVRRARKKGERFQRRSKEAIEIAIGALRSIFQTDDATQMRPVTANLERRQKAHAAREPFSALLSGRIDELNRIEDGEEVKGSMYAALEPDARKHALLDLERMARADGRCRYADLLMELADELKELTALMERRSSRLQELVNYRLGVNLFRLHQVEHDSIEAKSRQPVLFWALVAMVSGLGNLGVHEMAKHVWRTVIVPILPVG